MRWAQRLQRVFGIEACARCGGRLQVIASIEDPAVIARILAHLDRTSRTSEPELAPLAASIRVLRRLIESALWSNAKSACRRSKL
jgi:hypothetical protein